MIEKLRPIASNESYEIEDNCSGTLYVIPEHFCSGERCWRSNTCVREGDLNKTDVLLGEYACSCGMVFQTQIKDRFGQ